ncbi:alpha/beta fold hydrolase [Conexibacter sp. CPCC 206217]|uniref:alpha/beta fold hydrolase n=1 Tax=Conexibacter sp. CPCC 206217 TaxID=3064574 RepID=UPI0027249713|nr:alpha/beta hydrolase [Conexibacter sp. CPCC 206217]MDO8212061.1 alpha/beta hydrolase [Conexibacter sp. CPCC 206217]
MSGATQSAALPSYPGMPAARSIDVGGIDTWYTEAGSGTPVVFVYGGNFGTPESAPGAYAWDLAVDALSGSFRTIAYDKPAQGFSGNPADDADFTMAKVVEHLIGFVEALRLPPVHLVGHSRGGYVVTRTTLLRQDLVRSLTIVNSGTLSPGVGTNEVVLARPPHPPYTRESIRWVYESYCHDRRAVTDEWVERSFELVNRDAYREAVERIRRGKLLPTQFLPQLAIDKRETLTWLAEGRLQRPCQIVWGRNDRTAHRERGHELFRTIAANERRTVLNIVDKSGHFPYREHPAWFNDTVGRFIEEAGYDRG